MTQYEQKFRDILAEILQLDQAELDFGIYPVSYTHLTLPTKA